MPNTVSAFEIVEWLDDKSCTMYDCANGNVKGYSTEDFVTELYTYIEHIKKTPSFSMESYQHFACSEGVKRA